MKEISDLNLTISAKFTLNDEVKVTIEHMDGEQVKPYFLDMIDYKMVWQAISEYAAPSHREEYETFSLVRENAEVVRVESKEIEPVMSTLERLSPVERIAWFPFGLESVESEDKGKLTENYSFPMFVSLNGLRHCMTISEKII